MIMFETLEPADISMAISLSREEGMGRRDGIDLLKMIRFLNDQMLVVSYAGLN